MFHRYTHPRLRMQWFVFVVLLGVFALSMGAAKTAVAEPAAAVPLSTPYAQNFDTLAISGTSSFVPNGWAFSESGSNANTTYTAGTG
ncbi:MAG: hypothetical protein R6X34_29310, partial [Chloroflexota bacterium]